MASAIHPYALLTESSAVIHEFRHQVFYELANARIEKFSVFKKKVAEGLVYLGQQWLKEGKQQSLSMEEQESFYLLMLQLLETDHEKGAFEWQILTNLLLLYYQHGYFSKALRWLDLLEDCFSAQQTESKTELDEAAIAEKKSSGDSKFKCNLISLYSHKRITCSFQQKTIRLHANENIK